MNSAYFVLTQDRSVLYEKIDRRVDQMMEAGLLDEVRALKARGLDKNCVSMQGLGYKEILAYLDGAYSLDEAVRIIKRDTRHFAKRQLTWFRREKDVIWIDKKAAGYDEKIILVGAGNMGRALMKYNRWDYVVGEITCAFDIDPSRRGETFGVPVYAMDELEEKIPEGCRIAILAISKDIQATVDRLIACGITGLVDFTHEHIQVPKGVVLKTVDVVSSIQELVFETNSLNARR